MASARSRLIVLPPKMLFVMPTALAAWLRQKSSFGFRRRWQAPSLLRC